jgi:hypothetical protein
MQNMVIAMKKFVFERKKLKKLVRVKMIILVSEDEIVPGNLVWRN